MEGSELSPAERFLNGLRQATERGRVEEFVEEFLHYVDVDDDALVKEYVDMALHTSGVK